MQSITEYERDRRGEQGNRMKMNITCAESPQVLISQKRPEERTPDNSQQAGFNANLSLTNYI